MKIFHVLIPVFIIHYTAVVVNFPRTLLPSCFYRQRNILISSSAMEERAKARAERKFLMDAKKRAVEEEKLVGTSMLFLTAESRCSVVMFEIKM